MTPCLNIREFSISVYDFLTDVFKYNLNFSELGLTDHLLFHIVNYSHSSGKHNVEIYKMPWRIESVYGNDIDLLIQNNSGTFNWYTLQAKVMSPNGAYSDIKLKSIPVQQWDKLLNHETKFGSKSYYLLYNGKSQRPPKSLPTRSDCIGIPDVNEYGLGIVETSIIKNLRTVKLSSYGGLYFRHVFPDHIDSIRKLFCCVHSLPPTVKQFKREEISTNGYQKIYFNDNVKDDISDDDFTSADLIDGFAPIRIIVTTAEG